MYRRQMTVRVCLLVNQSKKHQKATTGLDSLCAVTFFPVYGKSV